METTHIFNPAILLGIYFLKVKVPNTNLKKNIYIHTLCAVHWKLTQHCKSTVLQFLSLQGICTMMFIAASFTVKKI